MKSLLIRLAGLAALSCALMVPGFAGVTRAIQDEYVRKYLNATYFLKFPLHGARQIMRVRQGGVTPDTSGVSTGLTFKVGQQVRITEVKFSGDSVRFNLNSVQLGRENEVVFRFPRQLEDSFPQRSLFDAALAATFTEGLTNADIDEAKRDYIRREFSRVRSEMANTASVSSDFVLKTVTDEIPGVAQARRDARSATSDLASTRSQLAEEREAREKAEAKLLEVRTDNRESAAVVESLKQEREALVDEKEGLRREVDRLEGRGRDYEKQLAELAESLNIGNSSNSDLSRGLKRLNENIENLKSERDRLANDLNTAQADLEDQSTKVTRLTGDLSATRRQRDRLQRSLRDLTSDKNSINSRYLKIQEELETLEKVVDLTNQLRVETRENVEFYVADVYLARHKIGTLEAAPPEIYGADYVVRFSAVSPDTVEFDENERALYETLGDEIAVETSWTTSSGNLEITLDGDAPGRKVAPRESAEWSYRFESAADLPARVTLVATIQGAGENKVPLLIRDFEISPGGFMHSARTTFSWIWLGVGVLGGMVVLAPVLFLRGRQRKTPVAVRHPAPAPAPVKTSYVSEKEF